MWLPVYQLLADPLLFSLAQWLEHFRLKAIVILLEQGIHKDYQNLVKAPPALS